VWHLRCSLRSGVLAAYRQRTRIEQRIGEGVNLLPLHFQDERGKRHTFDPLPYGIALLLLGEFLLE